MTTQIHFPTGKMKRGGWGYNPARDAIGWSENGGDQRVPTAFQCEVPLKNGAVVRATAVGNHILIDNPRLSYQHTWEALTVAKAVEKVDKPFITVEVLSPAHTSKITEADPNSRNRDATITIDHKYNPREHCRYEGQPIRGLDDCRCTGEEVLFAYLELRITAEDGTTATGEINFHQPPVGAARLSKDHPGITVESEFYGMRHTWEESLQCKSSVRTHQRNWGSSYTETRVEYNPLGTLIHHTHNSVLAESVDDWWLRFFQFNPPTSYYDRGAHYQVCQVPLDMDGLTAAMKKKGVKENLERLEKESLVDFTFFQWLMNGKTVEKRKNNTMLAAMLAKVGQDYTTLRDAIRNCRLNTIPTDVERDDYHTDSKKGNWFNARRQFCLQLPGVKDLIEEQEAKADWTKRRDFGSQADGLGVHAANFPMLRAAIEAGNIPTGVFVQPGSGKTDRTPVNIEFDLWEKALGRGWGETLSKIAKNASARSTYERDITPFLSFCFKIEKYLEKHTGHKWAAQPSFVESQWQLEMEETDDDKATVKRRSALTPVADNETCIVTVPYVAMAVSGVRTQWCYSRHYHLFEEGFTDPISGGIITKDFEPKLNGRDDYGLCYYTLTGTDTARGYPTFLIIFERLDSGTRVHFHRVHPHRSKKGVLTHASKMIEGCYQFMAGNIPASDVTAQQGDLIFLKLDHDPLASGSAVGTLVEGQAIDFESHSIQGTHHGAMSLYESKAKEPKNRLGFLHAKTAWAVRHPEHQDIEQMPEGWFEIRRCKSWEANPKAIWSRTID